MKGFIYNGKSTISILDSSKLVLCTFDSLDAITGSSREKVSGDSTISRPIANEYGTKSTPLLFEYALIKENGNLIADEEQRTIECWLTSPKTSIDLKVIDESGNIISIYCGLFLSTEWKYVSGGWAGVIFQFQCDSAYPKKYFSQTYDINTNGTITINCESDELEEYVYPILTITEPSETGSISIRNITDNNNTITIQALYKLPIVMDCLHCRLYDATTNNVISFADIGWTDVSNIYWLRLIPGENKLEITGNANIKIEFCYPCKQIGGWL